MRSDRTNSDGVVLAMKTLTQDEKRAERKRLRTWMAAQIAGALIRTWGEADPNSRRLAFHSVSITDAILDHLEETENS